MRLFIVLFSLLICYYSTFSSNNKYDEYVLTISKLDSTIKYTLNIDSAIHYAQEYLAIAKNINNDEYIKSGHYKLSSFYREKGHYKQSKSHIKEFITIAAKEKNREDLITGANMLGIIYKNLNQRGKALEMFFEGVNLLEQNENMNIHILSMFYNNIAVVYAEQNKYNESKNFLLKSKNLNDPDQNVALLLNNLGDTEMNLNNFQAAESYLDDAMNLIDSNNVSLLLVIKYSYAELYLKMNQKQKALQYAYDYTALASINGFTDDVEYGKELIDSILNNLNLLNEIQIAEVTNKKTRDPKVKESKKLNNNYYRNIIDFLLVLLVIFLGYKLISFSRKKN